MSRPKITALTCTQDRPDALALCHKYLARQTRPPDQWLVLDDSENPANILTLLPLDHHHLPQFRANTRHSMPNKVLWAIEHGLVKGDIIAFIEDDDHYRDDWLKWLEEMFLKGYEMVGEGHACYYHVKHRWWSECRNVRHAALCQTACHVDLLEPMMHIIKGNDTPFFDTRIWWVDCIKYLDLPPNGAENRVIGIKGMPGMMGYSGEHRDILPAGTHADPSMLQLWKWLGDDAAAYTRFSNRK